MTFSDALEVALGLTFVFLLMSLVLSSANEMIELLLRSRGAKLFEGLQELLGDPARQGSGGEATAVLYRHPLVQALFRGEVATLARGDRPSYIPSRSFARALIDQAGALHFTAPLAGASLPASATQVQRLRFAAERIDNDQLRRVLLDAIAGSGGDLAGVQRQLEATYDSAMDRVSGWYKRRSQKILFWLGLAAAVLLNVNTVTIARSLIKDSDVRAALVGQAERYAPPAFGARAIGDPVDQLRDTGLTIGWSRHSVEELFRPWNESGSVGRIGAGLEMLVGFLLTALATALGAPFWFDVLNRLMVIRATVKPHEKSREEGSQDTHDESRKLVVVSPDRQPQPVVPPPPALPGEAYDDDVFAAAFDPDERPREDARAAAAFGGL